MSKKYTKEQLENLSLKDLERIDGKSSSSKPTGRTKRINAPSLSSVKPQYPGKPQELSPCLGEERLLTNPPTEGGLRQWLKELEAHITQYGGTANYPVGECFGTLPGTSQHRDTVCGDMNGDGSINILDVVAMANCILASNGASGDACGMPCHADMNDDGGLNVLDLVRLVNCVLGYASGSLCDRCCGGDHWSDCEPWELLGSDGNCYGSVCSEGSRSACEDGNASCGACCFSTNECWQPDYDPDRDGCMDICEQGNEGDTCNMRPAQIDGPGAYCNSGLSSGMLWHSGWDTSCALWHWGGDGENAACCVNGYRRDITTSYQWEEDLVNRSCKVEFEGLSYPQYCQGDPDTVWGCTDPDACNYDPDATGDNDTCSYSDECEDCDGNNICNCNGELFSDMEWNGGSNDNWIADECGVCRNCEDCSYSQCLSGCTNDGGNWLNTRDCAGTCHPDDPASIDNCSTGQGWNPEGCWASNSWQQDNGYPCGDTPDELCRPCEEGFPLVGFIAQDWYFGNSQTHDNGCFAPTVSDNCGFCAGPNSDCTYDRCLCCPGLIAAGGWGYEGNLGYNGYPSDEYWSDRMYTSGVGDCVTVEGITDAVECEKHLCEGESYGLDDSMLDYGYTNAQRGIWGPNQQTCPSSVGCGCYNSGYSAPHNNCGCSSMDIPPNFVSVYDVNYPGYTEAFECCNPYCFSCWWHDMDYNGWEEFCYDDGISPGGVNTGSCYGEDNCNGVCNTEECATVGSGDGTCIFSHNHRAGGMMTRPIPKKPAGGSLSTSDSKRSPTGETGEPDANTRSLGPEFLVEGQSPSPEYKMEAKLKIREDTGKLTPPTSNQPIEFLDGGQLQRGGSTNCGMHTGKYDCEQNGCHWDFNDNYCH